MKRKCLAILMVLLLSIAIVKPVLAATWYGGNYYTYAYGAKSDIYTPSSAPYLGHYDGESSWVSTSGAYWIQTGWLYNGNDEDNAWSYVEANTSGLFYQASVATHSWNSSKNYKVLYDSPYWRCYVNNTLKLSVSGGGLPTPSTPLLAWAEVHESSSTVLNTLFTSVQYMDSSDDWYNFSENHLFADSPYAISGSNYYYLVYGP